MEGVMTEKLFYEDSHRKDFEAMVLSCGSKGELFEAVLNRTAFFPEGGGQYADTGFLNGIRVTDVHEKEGVIYHTVEKPLEAGTVITGEIDWAERFDKMQQHSGEHIVSGIVNSRFGYENVGFHLGTSYCTMDFNGPITKEELKEIEWEANRAVYQNLDIHVTYPTKEALKDMEYRSKIEIQGQVRIVTIPGYDVCACCAPHVKKTGEIGIIKLVNMMNYKGGERVTMLCGDRALQDYDKKQDITRSISNLLCEKEDHIDKAVEKLKEEQGMLKSRLAQTRQQLLNYKAREVKLVGDIVCIFDSELSGSEPREFMNLLLCQGAKVCAVFAGTDAEGYRYVIGSKEVDVRPLIKKLNTAFSGRGGGKPEMVQGSLSGQEAEIRKVCSNGLI